MDHIRGFKELGYERWGNGDGKRFPEERVAALVNRFEGEVRTRLNPSDFEALVRKGRHAQLVRYPA